MHEIVKKLNDEIVKYNPADHPEHQPEELSTEENRPLTQLATQEPESQVPDSQRTVSQLGNSSNISHVILLR